ncbi:MAG: DUF4118 domain-containing protein [Acidimicrobiales bacterium]
MTALAHRSRTRLLVALGPLAAIVAAAALVPVRGMIGNSNVALALAVVVVSVGALGGRLPATVTSVVAAAAFNVWHTRPYLSFKIDSRSDVITTVMLVVMGVVSGLVTEHGWRSRDRALLRVEQLDRIHRIAELAVAADDATAVWPTVRDTLCQELHLGSCWFEPDETEGLTFPELAHNGTLQPTREPIRATPGGYELPPNGVELAVTGAGKRLGRLVMLPDPGHALSLVDRRFAIAIANQFALVAARSVSLPPLW